MGMVSSSFSRRRSVALRTHTYKRQRDATPGTSGPVLTPSTVNSVGPSFYLLRVLHMLLFCSLSRLDICGGATRADARSVAQTVGAGRVRGLERGRLV